MLCTACQEIFRGQLDVNSREDEQHHPDLQSLIQSATQGCYICNAVYMRHLDGEGISKPDLLKQVMHTTYKFYFYGPRTPKLLIRVMRPELSDSHEYDSHSVKAHVSVTKICHRYFLLTDADLALKTYEFAPNTESEPCFRLATRWLSNCLTNHKNCVKTLPINAYHPTRLIEIVPLATASNYKVFLRIADEYSQKDPYITLSHCWGESKFLKLTKITYHRLQAGILGPETLSKTFQDAFRICQELGIRYLWIDALCIFQDSDEDWQREAACMGHVYENSFCNIAATAASNSDEGCFKARDISMVQPCTIKTTWSNQINESWEIMAESFWASRIAQAPLNSRGWVVQERWLSPRILHYGRHQILWECSELSACETYEGGLPEPLQNRASKFKLDPAGDASVPSDSGHYRSWARIVELYSAAKLTKPHDKLIALSGIAQRMQNLLGDHYLAGLWRRHLPSQLLWSLSHRVVKPPTRPKPYRAPSWSWASMDVGVRFPLEDDGTSLITVISVGVTPVTSDATGQIRDGFIRIKGKIFPGLYLSPAKPSDVASIQLLGKDRKMVMAVELDTSRQDLGQFRVYCLPIVSLPGWDGPSLAGLVLEAATQGNGTYERIGTFDVHNRVFPPNLDPNQLVEDKSLYEDANGETIMLI